MKSLILLCLNLFFALAAFAQAVTINGSVKDDQGRPIPMAFLRDVQHYYATYADSAGNFVLKADATSAITVIAPGYTDVTTKIGGKTSINIIMNKGKSSSAKTAVLDIQNENLGALSAYLNKQTMVSQSGTSTAVKTGFTQEPAKGSPYLYEKWARGFAITNGDSLLYDVNNLYNYDKTSGTVVFTKDGKNITEVSNTGVKSFNLFNSKLHPAVFVHAPAISKMPFIEVLLTTPRYTIYKQTNTKLIRADFHTDGVIESGHRYDEYSDVVHYYFVKPGEKPKQTSLKKKTLKELIGPDADKFISAQGDRDVDDDYVRELGYSLEQ